MDSLLQESSNDYEKTKYAELSGQFPAMSNELKKLIVKITNPTNTNLTSISADRCISNNEELAYFCSTVIAYNQRMNYSIISLYFNSINIDDIGMTHIVEVIKNMPKIEHLNISRCGIKDSSISILSHALPFGNYTLKFLYLDFNNITQIGLEEMFKGLKDNTIISTVDISGNQLYSSCVDMIKKFISSKRTLQYMGRSNTHITPKECDEIVQLYLKKRDIFYSVY
jgi:hypothetical protein